MLSLRPYRGRERTASRGFTLIELMVTISVIAVGMALVAPSFSQLIAGSRVKAGAESIVNGLNRARAEAVRRNSPVRFDLTGGSSWTVSQVAPTLVIQSRPGGDSAGANAASSNASTGVTFLPTGLVDSSAAWLTQITVSTAGGTDSRRINVLGGGLIRMCDPAATATSDPRRC